MPKIHFTALSVRNLKPAGRAVEYFDESRNRGEGALGIRVSPKGAKTWFIMYKANGKAKRYTIGKFPDLSLVEARKEASAVMVSVNTGKDPQQEKQDYKIAETFADLWMEYTSSPKFLKKARSSQKEEIRKYQILLKDTIGPMRVTDIRKKHLSPVLNKLARTAPVNANRLFSLLQFVFRFALNQGLIEIHPMFGMDKPGGREQVRKRYLHDEEISTIWPSLPDYFKLILLTCQRPGEVYAMERSEIDLEAGLWTLPWHKTKSKAENIVPLSEQAMAIIISRLERNTQFLFPSSSKSGHLEWTQATRMRIQKRTCTKGWTAHDLRRTGRTMLSRLGVRVDIAERILNHSRGRIEATYDLHAYIDEKRIAMDKLGGEVARITGQEDTAEINPFCTAG